MRRLTSDSTLRPKAHFSVADLGSITWLTESSLCAAWLWGDIVQANRVNGVTILHADMGRGGWQLTP